MSPTPIGPAGLAALLRSRTRRPLLVGLTGSVAAGKTTLATALVKALGAVPARVAHISTDGFLLPNAVLEARGLLLRKGFPESYDADTMLASLAALRAGTAHVPVHSHISYDIDPALTRSIALADIVIIEGLGLSGFPDGRSARDALDVLIYLDAEIADIEGWFTRRFLALWRAGANDPTSFYHRFAALPQAQAEALARSTWATITLPNLMGHISKARDSSDIVLHKDAEHRLLLVRA